MQIMITPGSPQSIYRQITDQMRMLVASGKVQVGDAVPQCSATSEGLGR